MSTFKVGDLVQTTKGDRYRQPEARHDVWEVTKADIYWSDYRAVICKKVLHVSAASKDEIHHCFRLKTDGRSSTLLEKNLILFKGPLPEEC